MMYETSLLKSKAYEEENCLGGIEPFIGGGNASRQLFPSYVSKERRQLFVVFCGVVGDGCLGRKTIGVCWQRKQRN